MGRTMAAIFTKQSGIRAVSVGADAHIGPLGSYEFAEDSRKIGTSCGWTRGVRPYRGRARVVVGADDSVGPLGSCEFAEDYRKIGIFCRLIRSPDHDFCFRVADAFFGAVGGHEADADGHDPKPSEEHKNDQNDLRCGTQ